MDIEDRGMTARERLENLYSQRAETESAIDDAAETDDGDAWEDLSDLLDEIEDEITEALQEERKADG